MNEYGEALEELTSRAEQIKITLENDFLIAVADQEISYAYHKLRELVDKENPIKPVYHKLKSGYYLTCKKCMSNVSVKNKYCSECGQKQGNYSGITDSTSIKNMWVGGL